MANVRDIYDFIDSIAPFHIQEDFDNAGFLVGRSGRSVKTMLVALDITLEVVAEAGRQGADLIVAHHPIIFHPVKSVTDETVTGQILVELLEQRIAAICAHTNLDAAHGGVNGCLAQALELSEIGQLSQAGVDGQGRAYGIGRVGLSHRLGLSVAEYAAYVKARLGASSVRFTDGGKPVEKVENAIAAGCDTFVTADLKYNQFLDARALGLNLLDAGHFPTENVVCAPLAARLSKAFPDSSVLVSQVHHEIYQAV